MRFRIQFDLVTGNGDMRSRLLALISQVFDGVARTLRAFGWQVEHFTVDGEEF